MGAVLGCGSWGFFGFLGVFWVFSQFHWFFGVDSQGFLGFGVSRGGDFGGTGQVGVVGGVDEVAGQGLGHVLVQPQRLGGDDPILVPAQVPAEPLHGQLPWGPQKPRKSPQNPPQKPPELLHGQLPWNYPKKSQNPPQNPPQIPSKTPKPPQGPQNPPKRPQSAYPAPGRSCWVRSARSGPGRPRGSAGGTGPR